MLRPFECGDPLNDRGKGREGHRQPVQRRPYHGAGATIAGLDDFELIAFLVIEDAPL